MAGEGSVDLGRDGRLPVLAFCLRVLAGEEGAGGAAVVFVEYAGKLSEALVTDGKRGFGDVCVPGGEQSGGVLHAQLTEVGGGAVTEGFGEGAAEVGGALGGGGGEFREADGVGEVGVHVGQRGPDRGGKT